MDESLQREDAILAQPLLACLVCVCRSPALALALAMQSRICDMRNYWKLESQIAFPTTYTLVLRFSYVLIFSLTTSHS